MGNRWIKIGGLALIIVIVVFLAVALNPFKRDDQDEIEIVHSPIVSNENESSEHSGEAYPSEEIENTSTTTSVSVIIFHNGTGPMCVEALDFFEENNVEVEEHLTTDPDFSEELNRYRDAYDGVSEGVSASFGYYPMIFAGDRAFSGFDEDIGREILLLIESDGA